MTSKRALELIKKEKQRLEYFKKECNQCVDDELLEAFDKVIEITEEYIEVEEISEDLDVLEILKKYFFVKISDTSTCDGFYYILLKDKNTCDYIGIYVNKEEKDLLKEYFKDDTPRT